MLYLRKALIPVSHTLRFVCVPVIFTFVLLDAWTASFAQWTKR